MNRQRIPLYVLTAIALVSGLSLGAILWINWINKGSIFPDYLNFLNWPAEKIPLNSIIASSAILVFCAILYLFSLRGRSELGRPLISIYLIAASALAPFGGWVAAFVADTSMALAVAAFIGIAFIPALLIFVFEYLAGGMAKILGGGFERMEAHGMAGRLFALASSLRPSDPVLLRRHALAEFLAGNYRRVIPILERLRARGEQDHLLLDHLAASYRQERQWGKETDVLKDVLQFSPGDAKYVRLLAQSLERQERWDEALAARESALDARNLGQLEDVARLALRARAFDHALEHTRRLREIETKPFKRSLEMYAELLGADPASVPALEEMADLFVHTNNEPKAVALWERILAHEPRHLETHRKLAAYFQHAGQLPPEEKHLRAQLEINPTDPETPLRLAENLLEQKRPEEAGAVLKAGVQHFPADYRFAFEFARQSLAAGDLAAAETALTHAETVAGKAEKSRLGALRRRLDSEKVNRELLALRQIIQQHPTDPEPRFRLIDRLAEMGDWPTVRMEFDRLLTARPQLRPPVIEHVNLLIAQTERNYLLQDYLADLLFADHDFEAVLAIYEQMERHSIHGGQSLMEGCRKILRVAPDFSPALARLGTLLVQAEQWAESIEVNTRFLERTEEYDAQKVHELYEAHLALGRIPEAESYASTLLAADPKNIDLRVKLIDGYEEAQRFEDAVRLARECVEITPGNMAMHRRLDILIRKRKRQRIEELEQELGREMEIPEAQFELGDLYEQFQEYDAAIAHFQRAARDELLRNLSTARLGHCLALRGMFDLASETLAQVQLDNQADHDQEQLKSLLYDSGVLFEEEGLSQRALEVYKTIFRVDASFRDIVSRLSRYRS